MKRNALVSIALVIVIMMMGACGNNAWDELPSTITKFVSEYFPFGEVKSYSVDDSGSTVQIKNGATLKFDNDYQWTDVNGNGWLLPVQFLYDQLPQTLYEYLESIEQQGVVYRVRRTPTQITVELHDSEIQYDRTTETITYPSSEDPTAAV